jgi:hypothetical protein
LLFRLEVCMYTVGVCGERRYEEVEDFAEGCGRDLR